MKRFVVLTGLLLALSGSPVLADPSAAAGEPVWCMVTDTGAAVAVSQVACLVAADDETTFAIVLQGGTVVDGVSRVTFDKTFPTGIGRVEDRPFGVNKELEIEGVAPDTPVRIYDTGGTLRTTGTARHTSLASLPTGIYIIQVNNTSFKINKK